MLDKNSKCFKKVKRLKIPFPISIWNALKVLTHWFVVVFVYSFKIKWPIVKIKFSWVSLWDLEKKNQKPSGLETWTGNGFVRTCEFKLHLGWIFTAFLMRKNYADYKIIRAKSMLKLGTEYIRNMHRRKITVKQRATTTVFSWFITNFIKLLKGERRSMVVVAKAISLLLS